MLTLGLGLTGPTVSGRPSGPLALIASTTLITPTTILKGN